MKVQTKRFGEIEVQEDKVLLFKEGLPGFENQHRFVLLAEKEGAPFYWLQSLDDADLAFVVTDPFLFRQDYDVALPAWEAEKIGVQDPQDAVIYVIVTIPEEPTQMTANLQAPLVINLKNRQARQVILGEGSYPLRYPILEAMRQQLAELRTQGRLPGHKDRLVTALSR